MNAHINIIDDKTLVELFYSYKLNIGASADHYTEDRFHLCDRLIKCLVGYSIDEVIEIIQDNFQPFNIKSSDIPQFSDLDICCYKVIETLICSGLDSIDLETMGQILRNKTGKKGANVKYGENHIKTASQMSLCCLESGRAKPSILGQVFFKEPHDIQEKLITRLLIRIPIIQNYYAKGENPQSIMQDISILKESTQKRRLTSIKRIINRIDSERKNYGL